MQRIGVYLATHNNPLFLRMALLQIWAQTLKPNVVAIHMNNSDEPYWWAVIDIVNLLEKEGVKVITDYSHEKLKHPKFHTLPLRRLIEADCDVYFKFDHDDFFYATHIEEGCLSLDGYDFTINSKAQILYLPYRAKFVVKRNVEFTTNPTGGMSDSVCFNKVFAYEYLSDMENTQEGVGHYSEDDTIMAKTMKKFSGNAVGAITTCYVTHGANTSTADWAENERLKQIGEKIVSN